MLQAVALIFPKAGAGTWWLLLEFLMVSIGTRLSTAQLKILVDFSFFIEPSVYLQCCHLYGML